jgi:hypothetical protein
MTKYKPLQKMPGRRIIAKAFFTILTLLIGAAVEAQVVSVAPGPWDSNTTWGGTPPDASSGTITIQHAVTMPNSITVTADEITIAAGGSLTVNTGSTFVLANGTGDDLTITSGALSVSGTFICNNLATLSGTTTVNTNFLSGSEFRYGHAAISNVVPIATWDPASTLNIDGVTTGGTVNSLATYWAQDFGNVTINCPNLGSFINFNGHLRNIHGNLNILNTGGSTTGAKQIVLATTTQNEINIDGSFIISGTSVVFFSVTGTTVTYDIGQDLQIATTTTTTGGATNITLSPTTFGAVIFDIDRDFIVNMPATATLNLTTAANSFNSTFRIGRNFTFTSGTMVEATISNKASFEFMGISNPQTFTRGASSTLPAGTTSTQIDWIVHPASTLNMGTSVMSSGTGSATTINGTLGVGSVAPLGALQNNNTTSSGNIQTGGTRTYGSTAVIVYNGTAPQVMANVHNVSGMDVIINNSTGVSQASSMTIGGDLTLTSGNLTPGAGISLTVSGNLSLPSGSVSSGNLIMGTSSTLTLNGNSSNHANNYISVQPSTNIVIGGTNGFGVFPFQPATTPTIGSFTLNRTGTGTVTFDHDVTISGNTILTAGNLDFSDQQLTLSGTFSAGTGRLFSNANSVLQIMGFANTGVLMFATGGSTLDQLVLGKQTVGTSVTIGSPLTVLSSIDLQTGILDNSAGITIGDGAVVTRDSDSEVFVAGFTNNPGESYDVVYVGGDPYTTGFELPTDAEDLNNLTIAGGPVTLDQNITVNGNMLLSSGELNTVSSTITIEGPTWEANGAIFSPGTGTVIFNATTLVFGDATPVFNNVAIGATGNVTLQSTETNIGGDFLITTGGQLNSAETIVLDGGADQDVGLNGNSIYNMSVNKASGTNVNLLSPMNLTGLLLILSTNTDFYSANNLTIVSTDDDNSGVQAIGIAPLPAGSTIEGDVHVQRYMSGEGRIWRYISSPITNGSVRDLMDYFPVTGNFTDPSTGAGLNSSTPSLYFYDEALLNANLQTGWSAYPTGGLAQDSPLIPGLGYSPFIREAAAPTTWVLTGPVNQGDVSLPVTFSNSGNATVDGWNLVGNPYPCSIFWGEEGVGGEDPEGWTRENVRNAITIRENSFTDENFLVWDGAIGDFSGDIAIGQAFWVQTTAAAPELTIHETAKSFTNGAFYRKSEVDYVQIVLSKDGSYNDRSYIRQRKNALSGLDNYDAPKMSNGYYTLSVKSSDNNKLAISAVPSILCGGTIQLDLAFAKNANGSFVKSPSGQYKLFANQFGLYGSHIVTLKDKFTGSTHTFQADQPYSFSISSDSQSYRSDRFELTVNETIPLTNLELAGSGVVCADPNAIIVIENAQADVEYQAFMNGVAISIPQAGQGHDLNLLVPNDSLNSGVNVVSIKALNGCASYDLAKPFTISKENAYTIASVASTEVCQKGSVTLTASGAPVNGVYKWYDKESDVAALSESTSPEFITPELSKPETFYVAITNSLGCEGPRIAVKANVINYDEAMITSDRVNELKSNYTENNTWYFNGTELDEHDQTIHAKESGIYRLEVTVNGCTTSAEQEYIVTGPVQEHSDVVFGVYPNPVEDILVIEGVADVNSVRMINVTGAAMKLQWIEKTENALRLWVGDLQSGIYYVSAREGDNRKTLKIIRK